jgi:hypothetical protein
MKKYYYKKDGVKMCNIKDCVIGSFGCELNCEYCMDYGRDWIKCENIEEETEDLPKYGELIEVRYNSDYDWEKRICIGVCSNGAVCVSNSFNDYFKEGKSYNTCIWAEWRKIEPKEEKLDISLNGEKIDLDKLADLVSERIMSEKI